MGYHGCSLLLLGLKGIHRHLLALLRHVHGCGVRVALRGHLGSHGILLGGLDLLLLVLLLLQLLLHLRREHAPQLRIACKRSHTCARHASGPGSCIHTAGEGRTHLGGAAVGALESGHSSGIADSHPIHELLLSMPCKEGRVLHHVSAGI